MGNWISGSCKPPLIEQPKYFGELPEPYPISEIKPTLEIFIKSSPERINQKKSNNVEPFVVITHEHSPEEAVQLIKNSGCLSLNQRLVVLTHGYRSDKNTKWLHLLKDTILVGDQQPQIVAILGWGGGSDLSLLKYSQAASNSLETGRWLGVLLLQIKLHFPQVKTYGIGHSLGAHLMGVAGRTGGGLDRITGLDPAGPGFQDDNVDKRLNSFDAQLVDVIHTDGQEVPYFGTLVPLGKIDFYPNYGWNQPSYDLKANSKPNIDVDQLNKKVTKPSPYGDYFSESHGRSIDYFIWSIENRGAFRTSFHLDGEPDVEKAIHRIKTTPVQKSIEVEMGYYTDSHLENIELRMTKLQEISCKEDKTGMACKQIQDDHSKFDDFEGNYYVHTNGSLPWS